MSLAVECFIDSTASCFPVTSFTQQEVGEMLGVSNPVVQRLLLAPHIQKRHLTLPCALPSPASDTIPLTDSDSESSERASPTHFSNGGLTKESRRQLHHRHLDGLRTFGVDAARRVLEQSAVSPSLVRIVVAVTSTGLAMPGFSAILMDSLSLPTSALRLDVVGMGCNAGMSALRTISLMLAGLNDPAAVGLLVCCEVCSAMYVNDDSTSAGIVNSLFGDGAVASIVRRKPTPLTTCLLSPPVTAGRSIALLDFECCTLPEYADDMMYVVSEVHDRMCFKLSKRIPYAVGDNVAVPVTALLQRHSLDTTDIQHWVVHSGGAAVIDGVYKNLKLSPNALRHTTSVLRNYGNISSGSFLVSLERLLAQHEESPCLAPGDRVVFIAMGPGATIEAGLGVVAAL